MISDISGIQWDNNCDNTWDNSWDAPCLVLFNGV